MLILPLMLMGMWLWKSYSEGTAQPPVAYSQLYQWIEQGKVESVVLDGELVAATLKSPETLEGRQIKDLQTNVAPNDSQLLPLLRQKGVRITVRSQKQPFAVQVLFTLLPWALIIAAWFWMSKRAKGMLGAGGPLGGLIKNQSRKFDKATSVNVTFNDIAGLKAAKSDLQEIVQFLKEPERFQRLGGKVPRGVLLAGPPGTGKTLLARAVAGESGVPFFSISGSEFIEMFVGLGAARVRDLFKEAKKSAPTIVFIDEIDAVGRSRGAGLGRRQRRARADAEPAALRDGRLRPDRSGRRHRGDQPARRARPGAAAAGPLRPAHPRRPARAGGAQGDPGRPRQGEAAGARRRTCDVVAQNTPGFSGADLANLVNEAALSATRKGRENIAADDFAEAFDKIVLGDLREAKLDAKEKRRVAVHESGHAVVARFSADAEPLHRVTIIPRGMALGATQQSPGEDRHLMAQAELESRLRVLMGGYASERLVLGSISTGAENDLKEATRLASHMMAHYGMSERLGPVYYDHEAEHPFLGQRIGTESGTSPSTITVIEEEARRVLARALEEASAMLAQRRGELDRLVAALLEHETLERDELAAILGPTAANG